MADMRKGIVTQVTNGGATAIIRPYGVGASLTPPLPVQQIKITRPDQNWTELHPRLSVGDSVAFVLFEDGTGLIIDKIQ